MMYLVLRERLEGELDDELITSQPGRYVYLAHKVLYTSVIL
jgi:hypothetical protein